MTSFESVLVQLRERLEDYEPSRERSLVATKLDEAELWLTRCISKEDDS